MLFLLRFCGVEVADAVKGLEFILFAQHAVDVGTYTQRKLCRQPLPPEELPVVSGQK